MLKLNSHDQTQHRFEHNNQQKANKHEPIHVSCHEDALNHIGNLKIYSRTPTPEPREPLPNFIKLHEEIDRIYDYHNEEAAKRSRIWEMKNERKINRNYV